MTRKEYDDYEARVKAFFEREGINCLRPVSDRADGEYEAFFSDYRCDVCRALPGNRYSCAGYNPTTRKTQGGYEVCENCLYYVTYGQLDDMTMIEVGQDDERIYQHDKERIAQMTDGYIECALWSSYDDSETPQPLDRTYTTANISRDEQALMQADCAKFYEKHKADLEIYADALDWEFAGHDFWRSRNGHGAGFFDRFDHRDTDEARALGDRLRAGARAFGEAHLMIDDDGELYYFNG